MHRHRAWFSFFGSELETSQRALAHLASYPPETVLWVSDEPPPVDYVHITANRVRRLLGRSFAAVVLDFHTFFDPNLLGQAHGFVWGGGTLVIRCPDPKDAPTQQRAKLHIHGGDENDVTVRFYRRFLSVLKRHTSPDPRRWSATFENLDGTQEQGVLVSVLIERMAKPSPTTTVLIADRGRGKSAALGMTAGALLLDGRGIAISAGQVESVDTVFRHIGMPSDQPRPFTSIEELAYGDGSFEIIMIDEAAQIPVPVLQRIVRRHPDAHFIFATTARGYEGSGRGFSLRFVEWLRAEKNDVFEETLREPIRWSSEDPLETMVFDALLLDAQCEELGSVGSQPSVNTKVIDRDKLVNDETRLRAFFGLLIQAHYRTTPSDVQLLLDGPNVELHALLEEGRMVAATMVAREGALSADVVTGLYWGQSRLRGHALPETLVSHSGCKEAGFMEMIRSVRIAVHPERRRLGYATKLVQHVHGHYSPDLFGTLFGTTAGLLQFRRKVGYDLVRVGASRGTRTGEPAAVMIRPMSARAQSLVRALRHELARELPIQLELMQAGRELLLNPTLRSSLLLNLPAVLPLAEDERLIRVARFAFGPSTQESVASALKGFVQANMNSLEALSESQRDLIQQRILEGHSWSDTMEQTGMPSIPATMRALRRAVRALVIHADPELGNRVGVP